MTWVGAIILLIGFLVILRSSSVIEKATTVIGIAAQSQKDLFSAELDDDAKELAMRKNAILMFQYFLSISAWLALCLLAPLAIVYGLHLAEILVLDEVLELSVSWEFLLIAVLLSAVFFFVSKPSVKQ